MAAPVLELAVFVGICLSVALVWLLLGPLLRLRDRSRLKRQEQGLHFVLGFDFPQELDAHLRYRYPRLRRDDRERVLEALRDYFALCIPPRNRNLAVPSALLSELWAEFSQLDRAYRSFCDQVFGQKVAPKSLPVGPSGDEIARSLRRTWEAACLSEQIDPKIPQYLPRIFAIDEDCEIVGGLYFGQPRDDDRAAIRRKANAKIIDLDKLT